jgi:hypothetical protein
MATFEWIKTWETTIFHNKTKIVTARPKTKFFVFFINVNVYNSLYALQLILKLKLIIFRKQT